MPFYLQLLCGVSLALLLSSCDQATDTPKSSKETEISQVSQEKPKPSRVVWSEAERSLLQSLSIRKLPDVKSDSSNRYQLDKGAMALGEKLFFDSSLSATGTVSCAFCHQPNNQFSDGKKVAIGVGEGARNTPSLLGATHQQWFFWDGRKDSAWAQALEPFENPDEHNLSRVEVIKKVLANVEYKEAYMQIFADAPSHAQLDNWPNAAKPNGDLASLKLWKSLPIESRKQINRVFSNIGKSLAAYETTLKFPESRFDRYLDQLKANEVLTELTTSEEAGLQLFVGKAACVSCHHSPLLSSQHFQNIATGTQGKDTGRAMVAEAQRWDVFNCLGEYSDAAKDECKDLSFMNNNRHELSGSFKVPSLRSVSKTAPYMHDGRFERLEQVVEHYANPPSLEVVDHHMPVISISEFEKQQLVDFLKAL